MEREVGTDRLLIKNIGPRRRIICTEKELRARAVGIYVIYLGRDGGAVNSIGDSYYENFLHTRKINRHMAR